jgi:hypothetical protein
MPKIIYATKDEKRRHKLCSEVLKIAGERGMTFDDVFDECEVPASLFFFPSLMNEYWENELKEYKELQLDLTEEED